MSITLSKVMAAVRMYQDTLISVVFVEV